MNLGSMDKGPNVVFLKKCVKKYVIPIKYIENTFVMVYIVICISQFEFL